MAGLTPVERCVLDGIRSHRDDDGFKVADDHDVARVAEAVADHRAALMDRLAR